MAIPLRQSTASQEIPLGPFVDSLDGNTAETGLTIANTDIKIWRTGATTLADKTSGGGTHISGGIYYAVLDATDTATLGPLIVTVHVAGALPVRVECMVMSANAYDSMIAGSAVLDVNATQISGSTTAADNLEVWFDADKPFIRLVVASATDADTFVVTTSIDIPSDAFNNMQATLNRKSVSNASPERQRISDYTRVNGTRGTVQLASAFTSAPAAGDILIIQ